jgi:hypothetical protein
VRAAPRGWQFVVWGRQFALFLTYAVPSLALDFSSAPEDVSRAVVWAHAAVGILILLGAWRVHKRVKPYYYAFQNALEDVLFASDVLALALGTLYTWLYGVGMSAGVQSALEALLLAVFVGGIVAAAVHTYVGFREGKLFVEQATVDAERRARQRADSSEGSGAVNKWARRAFRHALWLDDEEEEEARARPRLTVVQPSGKDDDQRGRPHSVHAELAEARGSRRLVPRVVAHSVDIGDARGDQLVATRSMRSPPRVCSPSSDDERSVNVRQSRLHSTCL